jgi:hypothetical protein
MNQQQRAALERVMQSLASQPEPVQSAERGEPVAMVGALNEYSAMELVNRGFSLTDPLYTTPPAQPAAWVGLDGLEMSDLWLDTPFDDCTEETFAAGRAFIEAIEAKLREKNGGGA